MNATSEQCAREVLETVPLVMRFIRGYVRHHPAAGLVLPQFRTLSFLSRSKEPSLSEVAEHLGLALPAMSRLVNDLVQRGWVGRRPVPSNRRQIALELTGPGRARLESMRAAIRRQLAKNFVSLPAADHQNIRAAMQALRRAFESQPVKKAKAGGMRR
jgi:DNA-binding MarR family transcriptional regulator